METISCNLCGSNRSRVLYSVRDLQLGNSPDTFQYVKCEECGLVYQNPRLTADELQRYYPDEYESYHPSGADNLVQSLHQVSHQYGMKKRCHEVIRYKKSGSLLDIGCANGSFLQAMQTYPGWEVQGIEPSVYATETARQRELQVINGSLEQVDLPTESFDVITLWDVLEHLPNPIGGLHKIQRWLKPGGIIICRVPNGASWEARLFGKTWSGIDAPRHLFIYTPGTIQQMLEKTGFRRLDMHSRIGSYSSFILSLRFWMVYRNIAPRHISAIQHYLAHPLARLAFAPLFFLGSIHQQGAALVVAAQRQ